LQFHVVGTAGSLGLICKTESMQGGVKKVTTGVASEHAPRPVAAMGTRRQAQDQYPCADVSETGHWPTPVDMIGKCTPFASCHILTVTNQSRTTTAAQQCRRIGSEVDMR
jgi:hypothetical protein